MKLYLGMFSVLLVILCTFNAFVSSTHFAFSTLYGFWASLFAAIGVFLIDLSIACIVRVLPKKWFDPERKFFRSARFENTLYLKLGIRAWKDKIPEVGKLLKQLDKTKVGDKNDPKHLMKFLHEMGYAEVMHWISIPLAFLIIFCFPLEYWFLFGLPCAIANACFQILPVMVQRYNRPKLLAVYKRALRNSKNDL